MKFDRALEEVWKWREGVNKKYEGKSDREIIELIRKNTEETIKKYNLKLKVVNKT